MIIDNIRFRLLMKQVVAKASSATPNNIGTKIQSQGTEYIPLRENLYKKKTRFQ